MTEIDGSAFAYCTSLYSVIVSADNPVYDSRQWCNAIIETATNTLVAGCSNCFIPEGVTSIKENALCGFTFSRIDIPKSVTSMGVNTFMGCTSLSTIIVHGGNPVYDSRQGCNAIIETKTNTLVAGCNGTFIPESVTSIGGSAFLNRYSLTSIDIPEGVTSIGNDAFYGCSSLTSIDIPEGVWYIGEYAFLDCTSLTSISIPSSVMSIMHNAFSGCTSLTTFVCRAEEVPDTWYAFEHTTIAEATLYVPASSIEAYKAADGWKDFGTIRPLEDYETGIDTPSALQPDEAAATAAPYYTIVGQRVNAPVRGHIYIRSGRKVIY